MNITKIISSSNGSMVKITFNSGESCLCYLFEKQFFINHVSFEEEVYYSLNIKNEHYQNVLNFFKSKGCKLQSKYIKNVFRENQYLRAICLL